MTNNNEQRVVYVFPYPPSEFIEGTICNYKYGKAFYNIKLKNKQLITKHKDYIIFINNSMNKLFDNNKTIKLVKYYE